MANERTVRSDEVRDALARTITDLVDPEPEIKRILTERDRLAERVNLLEGQMDAGRLAPDVERLQARVKELEDNFKCEICDNNHGISSTVLCKDCHRIYMIDYPKRISELEQRVKEQDRLLKDWMERDAEYDAAEAVFDKRVAELEIEAVERGGRIADLEARCENNDKFLAQLVAEKSQLGYDLLEFGRHSAGCSYPFSEASGCKCGWLEMYNSLTGGRQHDGRTSVGKTEGEEKARKAEDVHPQADR